MNYTDDWLTCPVPTFQMTTLLSDPAERRMFCAEGCHRTRPTRRWCFTRSTTESVIVLQVNEYLYKHQIGLGH